MSCLIINTICKFGFIILVPKIKCIAEGKSMGKQIMVAIMRICWIVLLTVPLINAFLAL